MRTVNVWGLSFLCGAIVVLALGAAPVSAAELCVKPGGADGCYATIQSAVDAATGGDTITIAAGTYAEHDIALDKNLTLQGAGDSTVVDANQQGRVFSIGPAATVALAQMQLVNGKLLNQNGGAVYNLGTLTLDAVTLLDNQVYGNSDAYEGGGAIYNQGTLSLLDSTLQANSVNPPSFNDDDVQQGAGALWNNGTATIRDTLFLSNTTGAPHFNAGAIYNNTKASLDVQASRFIGNIAYVTGEGASAEAGAILNTGTVTLTNVLFSNNHAGCGGAIVTAYQLTIASSTFELNSGHG